MTRKPEQEIFEGLPLEEAQRYAEISLMWSRLAGFTAEGAKEAGSMETFNEAANRANEEYHRAEIFRGNRRIDENL